MAPWWKGAVVCQIHVRSFLDSDGDGHGDLAGVMAKLDYLKRLGVDAVRLSPIHPSPNRDWGYDVSDYDDVHPDHGSMEDFQALTEAAHARGMKAPLDEALSHTSEEHPWFAASRDEGAAWPPAAESHRARAEHPAQCGGELLPVTSGASETLPGGLALGPYACRFLKHAS